MRYSRTQRSTYQRTVFVVAVVAVVVFAMVVILVVYLAPMLVVYLQKMDRLYNFDHHASINEAHMRTQTPLGKW